MISLQGPAPLLPSVPPAPTQAPPQPPLSVYLPPNPYHNLRFYFLCLLVYSLSLQNKTL